MQKAAIHGFWLNAVHINDFSSHDKHLPVYSVRVKEAFRHNVAVFVAVAREARVRRVGHMQRSKFISVNHHHRRRCSPGPVLRFTFRLHCRLPLRAHIRPLCTSVVVRFTKKKKKKHSTYLSSPCIGHYFPSISVILMRFFVNGFKDLGKFLKLVNSL